MFQFIYLNHTILWKISKYFFVLCYSSYISYIYIDIFSIWKLHNTIVLFLGKGSSLRLDRKNILRAKGQQNKGANQKSNILPPYAPEPWSGWPRHSGAFCQFFVQSVLFFCFWTKIMNYVGTYMIKLIWIAWLKYNKHL